MIVNKGCIVKLDPTEYQTDLMVKTGGCAAYVYNYYLARCIEQYKNIKKTDGYYEWQHDLVYRLKPEKEFLQEPIADCLQQSLLNLKTAFKNFFDSIKGMRKGEKVGYPTFKKLKYGRSFRVSQGFEIDYENNLIWLPKIGWVKCSSLDRVEGKVKSITIKQDRVGDWFASILTEVDVETIEKTGKGVGIDLGIKTLMTLSNGEYVDRFKWLMPLYKRVANLQRSLSRKVKGSNNYKKARVRVAKAWRYIARRTDYTIHEITTYLVRTYDHIYLEDLSVQEMAKTKPTVLSLQGRKTMRRNLYRSCFNKIKRYISYKQDWYGGSLTLVDKDFPSSKLCSCCGWKKKDLNLSHRKWTCKRCKNVHDRDENAAKNIQCYGRRKRREGIDHRTYQSDLYQNYAARTAVNRVCT